LTPPRPPPLKIAIAAYMRRATNTINYGKQLPLAQGVRFDI
jgi:hypothetical protein